MNQEARFHETLRKLTLHQAKSAGSQLGQPVLVPARPTRRPTHVDNSGMSAQPATGDGRPGRPAHSYESEGPRMADPQVPR
jgi:hypothetical protein